MSLLPEFFIYLDFFPVSLTKGVKEWLYPQENTRIAPSLSSKGSRL